MPFVPLRPLNPKALKIPTLRYHPYSTLCRSLKGTSRPNRPENKKPLRFLPKNPLSKVHHIDQEPIWNLFWVPLLEAFLQKPVKPSRYTDTAVAGEAAAYAIGLVMVAHLAMFLVGVVQRGLLGGGVGWGCRHRQGD